MVGVTRSTLASLAFTAVALACGESGNSGPSAPSAPTGLAATPGSGAVALTWSAVPGATSYFAYRATSTSALSSKTKIGSASATVFNDTTVVDGATYFYQVTASNAGGESGGSSEVSATPSSALPPVAPTGVTATGGTSEVTVSWGSISGAVSYNLYWSATSPVTKDSSSITGVTSPYVHSPLVNGTTYYYAVTAVNGNGESGLSAEVSATPSSALPKPFIEATIVRWTLPKPSGVPIQQVRVCTEPDCSSPVSGATVQVNTTILAWDPIDQQYTGNVMPAENYKVTLTVTIPAGSTVEAGTYTVTAPTYASAPYVTMPTSSTTWSRAATHYLTWTGGAPTSTTPASVYVVGISDAVGSFYPVKPNDSPTEVPISNNTFTLEASTLPAAGTYIAFVAIATTGIADHVGGIAIPGAATGSELYIGYVSAVVPFTVTN